MIDSIILSITHKHTHENRIRLYLDKQKLNIITQTFTEGIKNNVLGSRFWSGSDGWV